MQFQVGDYVYLKVSPMKGVKRFGKKGKLAPRFVGPFEVAERIGAVTYRVRLPEKLRDTGMHDVFHVSMLRKHVSDPSKRIDPDLTGIQISSDSSTVVKPHRILDRSEKRTRRTTILMVKVQWDVSDEINATWEIEDDVRRDYPELFEDRVVESRGRDSYKVG